LEAKEVGGEAENVGCMELEEGAGLPCIVGLLLLRRAKAEIPPVPKWLNPPQLFGNFN